MKPKLKQTVYLPVNEQYEYSLAYWDKRDRSYQIEKDKNGEDISLKEQEGYFFTPEELNEYTANVIKKALKVAVENVEIHSVTNHSLSRDFEYAIESGRIWVPSNSITNAFDQTYKEFEV